MKKFIVLLLASSLVGCAKGDFSPEPAPSEPVPPFAFHPSNYDYYWAPAPPAPVPPASKNLCCVVTDRLPGGPKPLTIGRSGVGEGGDWSIIDYYNGDVASGKLKMVLQAPPKEYATLGTVSIGAFRPVDFGLESAFTLRATFQNPTPVPSDGWSFTVVARTGDPEHDTPNLWKIQLSVRIRPADIDVRIQEVNGDSLETKKIAHETFNWDDSEYYGIYGGEPITISLKVHRKTGKVGATIIVGTKVWSVQDLSLDFFGVDSGPPLSTAGVGLATDTDWGKTISVEVADFMICAGGVPC